MTISGFPRQDTIEERHRLLAVELAGIQEEGDMIASRRQLVGTPDVQLEALLARLSRARSRLSSTPEFDRS